MSLLERVQTVSCEEVIIRPDCPLDLSYNMLHSFSREVFDNPYFEDEPDIEQRCLVLDLLQGSQRVVGGGIWFSVGPKPELADMLYIKVLYLKEEFRRMGYGKRLVETAIDEGSACDTVYLRAPSSAWRFYEEVGFSMIDTYKVKGKLFGSFFKRLS